MTRTSDTGTSYFMAKVYYMYMWDISRKRLFFSPTAEFLVTWSWL